MIHRVTLRLNGLILEGEKVQPKVPDKWASFFTNLKITSLEAKPKLKGSIQEFPSTTYKNYVY